MTSVRSAVAVALVLALLGLTAGEIKNKGWWRNAVFYQVYPRSFMDSNGDGIGDLKGITQKLSHFVNSSITGIWLSPVFTSPMVDFGYDISDFRDIDGPYGTMKDLEELTRKAKELNVKVILDLVPNHSSDQHEWFKKSVKNEGKYADYYIWRKGRNNNADPPNNWVNVFGGTAWTYDPNRQLWYFHQFDYRQPDLNYANDAVKDEMGEVIKFWLNKGVDGFRIDAIPHVFEVDDLRDEPKNENAPPGTTPHEYAYLDHIYTKDDPRTYELMLSWRKLVDDWADKNNSDEKVLMTEAYTTMENTTKYYKYGSNIPFNFNFIMNITKNSKAQDFKNVIDDWMKHTPSDQEANWVMGNHDRKRTATRFPGKADQMTILEMILPGVAVTYYGEEIGMEDRPNITWEETQDPAGCNAGDDWEQHTRDPNRTPMQWDDTKNAGFSVADETWLPVHDNYKELNLKNQLADNQSHYNVYRKLTKLRKESPALQSGDLKVEVINNGSVLVVIRSQKDKPSSKIMLIMSFSSNQSVSTDLSTFAGTQKITTVVSSIGSDIEWGLELNGTKLNLQSESAVVLSTNSGISLLAPMKAVLFVIFFFLYKLA